MTRRTPSAKAGCAAQHLDSGLQQDHRGGAVHIVVAVKQHRLTGCDGPLQALDGRGHSQHQEGIVQMALFGIEEGMSLGGLGNAASYQQFSQNLRQTCCPGQFSGLLGMLRGDGPTLAGRRVRHAWGRDSLVAHGCIGAHPLYSSSSSS